jgi:hypothetical protein
MISGLESENSEHVHTTISPFVFNHLRLDLPPLFVLRSGVTKLVKEKEREMENVIKKTRKTYHGEKWLEEFANGVRLIELDWTNRTIYRGSPSKKLENV